MRDVVSITGGYAFEYLITLLGGLFGAAAGDVAVLGVEVVLSEE